MWLKVIEHTYDEWVDTDKAEGVRVVKVIKAKTGKESHKLSIITAAMGVCDVMEFPSHDKAMEWIKKTGLLGGKKANGST